MNLEIVSRSGNKWLRFDKASNDYPFFKKIHYSSTARFWRYEQYSPVEGSFYQLKQCHIPHGLCQELQNFPFASFSPLATKHCDWYVLTVPQIIDFFMFWRLLPCKFDGCKLSLSPFYSRDLQNNIDWKIEYSQILLVPTLCKVRSSLDGYNSLLNCCQGTSNDLNLWSVECTINVV